MEPLQTNIEDPVDETQVPKPQKYAKTYLICDQRNVLAGLRRLQSMSNPIERHCMFLIILNFKFMKAGYSNAKINLLEQIIKK